MTIVRLECKRILDWDSFHSVFQEVFGFPSFYGRNMDAWIDCMSYLDEPDARMSSIFVPPGSVLTLELHGAKDFTARCPEQFSALIECAAFVNWRRSSNGEGGILALAYNE